MAEEERAPGKSSSQAKTEVEGDKRQRGLDSRMSQGRWHMYHQVLGTQAGGGHASPKPVTSEMGQQLDSGSDPNSTRLRAQPCPGEDAPPPGGQDAPVRGLRGVWLPLLSQARAGEGPPFPTTHRGSGKGAAACDSKAHLSPDETTGSQDTVRRTPEYALGTWFLVLETK